MRKLYNCEAKIKLHETYLEIKLILLNLKGLFADFRFKKVATVIRSYMLAMSPYHYPHVVQTQKNRKVASSAIDSNLLMPSTILVATEHRTRARLNSSTSGFTK